MLSLSSGWDLAPTLRPPGLAHIGVAPRACVANYGSGSVGRLDELDLSQGGHAAPAWTAAAGQLEAGAYGVDQSRPARVAARSDLPCAVADVAERDAELGVGDAE